jgi:hypothetical protein
MIKDLFLKCFFIFKEKVRILELQIIYPKNKSAVESNG